MLFNVLAIGHYGNGYLIVWIGIMLHGYLPSHVFEGGAMKGVMCRYVIFGGLCCLLWAATGPDFIFIDKARPYKVISRWIVYIHSHLFDEFCGEDIRRMD